VLLRRALAVLVRSDRDVLGAVVRSELAPAKREQRGGERERPGGELLHGGRETGLADRTSCDAGRDERSEHPGPLEGEAGLGKAAANPR
jgi:hypothetical protein